MLTKAPIADDWSGFYVGGHLGFATAGSDFTATQPGRAPDLTGTLDLFRPYDLLTGEGTNFGGFQAGYNTVFKSGLMVGVEADISFRGNMTGTSILATPSIGAATYSDLVEMSGSVHTRIGYAFDRWLYYGTAGYAWTADHLTRTQLSDNPARASGASSKANFRFGAAGRSGRGSRRRWCRIGPHGSNTFIPTSALRA